MSSGPARGSRIVRCPACQRYYRITTAASAPGTRLRCTKCGEVFPLAGASTAAADPVAAAAPVAARASAKSAAPGRVLLATDGVEFQSLITEVLGGGGLELRCVRSGEEAWEALGAWRPHVALFDVGLPGVPSFELCDRVRATPAVSGTGLILIASVFQQTRYKRAPTSLYGADDYIEKHHIRDWLPEKIARLLPPRAVAPPPLPPPPAGKHHPPIDEREQETLISEELGLRGEPQKGLERIRENLRRFARIIVSDIALYNQELVEEGIREGTFTELLGKELTEGRRLYLTRVPPSVGGPDLFEEAVRNFIAKRSGDRTGAPPRKRGGHGPR